MTEQNQMEILKTTIKTGIHKTPLNKSVDQLVAMNSRGHMSFSLAIQRGIVWDVLRKSKLIHSIFYGYPVPAFYAQVDNDVYYMLDGKQRLTSIFSFIQNEWPLHPKTPSVLVTNKVKYLDGKTEEEDEIIHLAGKYYKDLPDVLKDKLTSTSFTLYKLSNMTAEEVVEMFLRLNGQMPLTKWELNRAELGDTLMDYLNESIKSPFWSKTSSLNRNRFEDQMVTLQMISILDGQREDLFAKSMHEYSQELRRKGIQEDIKKTIIEGLEYLDSLPLSPSQMKRMFKKAHIPIIMQMYADMFNVGEDEKVVVLEPNVFANRLVKFFHMLDSNKQHAYNISAGKGMGKWTNVKTRIDEMRKFFDSCKDVSTTEDQKEVV